MSKLAITAVLLAGSLLAVAQQEPAKTENGTTRAATDAPAPQQQGESSATAASSGPQDSDYVIGADDVIAVNVWKEPEITREVVVRPDGKISLPLIQEITVADLTAAQASKAIAEALSKFIAKPEVTVIVRQTASQTINVMGPGVNRAGKLQLRKSMTVLDALAESGGLNEFANAKKIVVIRKSGERLNFNYKDVIKGKNTEQNIELKKGDTVYVP